MRRINPRGLPVTGQGEPGGSNNTHRLIRRGMPYGPTYDPTQPYDGIERGLLGYFIRSKPLALAQENAPKGSAGFTIRVSVANVNDTQLARRHKLGKILTAAKSCFFVSRVALALLGLHHGTRIVVARRRYSHE
jgi:hypothetical protein